MKQLRHDGFTIASLLLLTAIVAIYAAGLMTIRRMDSTPDPLFFAVLAGVGLGVGVILGWALSVTHGARRRDVVIGTATGAVFGPPSAVLLAVPDSLPIVLVGSVVLIAFAIAVRMLSPNQIEEELD